MRWRAGGPAQQSFHVMTPLGDVSNDVGLGTRLCGAILDNRGASAWSPSQRLRPYQVSAGPLSTYLAYAARAPVSP